MSTELSHDSEVSGQSLRQEELRMETRAQDLLARGRQLNTGSTFNQESFDLLTEAIKLDPYLIDAWIGLTKCYQRKSDIDGAITCLENALENSDKPNKIILRQLSTCLRQKNCDSQEAKITTLMKSLELAKQALKEDLNDEENYYNLSKAYMCLFFVTECVEHRLINLSRAAYAKALALSNENLAKGLKNSNCNQSSNDGSDLPEAMSRLSFEEESKPFIEQSDFLYNYSTVLIYFQEFDKALEYLRLATKLEPEWNDPRALEECVIDYLKQIQSILHELGKNLKKVVRRYSKVIESLKNTSKIESDIQADQQRLKQSKDIKVKSVTLNELENDNDTEDDKDVVASKKQEMEKNLVKLLHLKLVCIINYNQAMYLTFIAIDKNYSLVVVTIYNLAASRCPSPRDVVTLVDPKIDQIKVDLSIDSIKGPSVMYNRIDAREFKGFYVNGHRISIDQVSKPQFKISVLP